MKKNVLHQSSPVQQLMAAGGPNWWNINTMRPQNSAPPQHSSPVLAHPSPNLLPQFPLSSTSAWNDNQELPYPSLSQLLMGGMIAGEDKSGLSHMQKLDIFEEQLLQQEDSNGSNLVDHVKQENLANHYHVYGTTSTTTSHGITTNAEYQQVNIVKPSWSQVMSVSSPTSCVTSLSSTSNMLDFTNIKEGRHPPPDRSSEV